MNILDMFLNPFLIAPTLSWLIAQVIKTIVNAIVNRKIEITRLFGDGGMPSGHSATVVALATMCGIDPKVGFDSPLFAVTAILAIIVMHDALGVRRETGKQAVSIISIAAVINDYLMEHDANIKTDKLKVLVGHTPLQVVCGGLLGIVVSVVYYFVLVA